MSRIEEKAAYMRKQVAMLTTVKPRSEDRYSISAAIDKAVDDMIGDALGGNWEAECLAAGEVLEYEMADAIDAEERAERDRFGYRRMTTASPSPASRRRNR